MAVVKVAGGVALRGRAEDQHGQVVYVAVSKHRDMPSARWFFIASLTARRVPVEVVSDRAPALAIVIEELIPAAFDSSGHHENNRCECDHGRLKTDRTASLVIRGHAFTRNVSRGHYELGVETVLCSGWRLHSTNSSSRSEWFRLCPRSRTPYDRLNQQCQATPPSLKYLEHHVFEG